MSVERIVQRQAGVIGLHRAVEAGMSARTVQRRVAGGVWRELLPLVYLVSGRRRTDEARVRAAWLWAGGSPAAVSGLSGAYWHGMLDVAPTHVELTVPRVTHRQAPPGVVVRRSDLHAFDLVEHRGLLVTDAPLAALQAAIAHPKVRPSSTGPCGSTCRSSTCTTATAATWAGAGGDR